MCILLPSTYGMCLAANPPLFERTVPVQVKSGVHRFPPVQKGTRDLRHRCTITASPPPWSSLAPAPRYPIPEETHHLPSRIRTSRAGAVLDARWEAQGRQGGNNSVVPCARCGESLLVAGVLAGDIVDLGPGESLVWALSRVV